jgi:hypothetical protein
VIVIVTVAMALTQVSDAQSPTRRSLRSLASQAAGTGWVGPSYTVQPATCVPFWSPGFTSPT